MITDENDKKVLSLYQLEVLLKTTAAQDLTKSPKSWLTQPDMKLLLEAIDNDANRVYLTGMGRYFDIQYQVHNTDNKVWLSPTGPAFVPCGWFSIKEIKREVDESVYTRA